MFTFSIDLRAQLRSRGVAYGAGAVLLCIGCSTLSCSKAEPTGNTDLASELVVPAESVGSAPIEANRGAERAASESSGSSLGTGVVSCSPLTLSRSDVLTVWLGGPHGGDIAVVDPDGQYWFICFIQPDPKSDLQPIFDVQTCRELRKLPLAPASARGIRWNDDDPTPRLIFGRAGQYRVVVSETLETEDPLLDGQCSIDYQP